MTLTDLYGRPFKELPFWPDIRDVARSFNLPIDAIIGDSCPQYTPRTTSMEKHDINTLFLWSSVPGYTWNDLHMKLAELKHNYCLADLADMAGSRDGQLLLRF